MYIDSFQTIADPTRRRIIDALQRGERQVGALVGRAGIRQSGVSRHLRILTEAGFVSMRTVGQRHLYALRAEPFRDLAAWLARYRSLWDAHPNRFGATLEKPRQRRSRVLRRG